MAIAMRTTSEPLHKERLATNGITVVVPVFNEAETVGALFDELREALTPLDRPWEVVFVDDGSTDATAVELARLRDADPRVRALRLRRNSGKAAALAAGFENSTGSIVVTIDADLQDVPAEIPRLLAKLDEGFDLVSGWKAERKDPLRRRVLSRVFNFCVNKVAGTRLHDQNCGLKAYRREVVSEIDLYGELHRFIPALAQFRGYTIAEVTVSHRARTCGRSRYGLERCVRGLLDLLTVVFIGRYRYRPLHLFGGVGLFLAGVGVAICLYLTALKAAGEAIGHRPLLVLGALLIVVGIQFLFMGLIAELLTSMREERHSSRRRFKVDELL
jgi:glycosyltransferase involved in cell wall biosynthesis